MPASVLVSTTHIQRHIESSVVRWQCTKGYHHASFELSSSLAESRCECKDVRFLRFRHCRCTTIDFTTVEEPHERSSRMKGTASVDRQQAHAMMQVPCCSSLQDDVCVLYETALRQTVNPQRVARTILAFEHLCNVWDVLQDNALDLRRDLQTSEHRFEELILGHPRASYRIEPTMFGAVNVRCEQSISVYVEAQCIGVDAG